MTEDKKELAWGETPLDKLTPDEVLLAAKRMYGALISANSCLSMMRSADKNDPYWARDGIGGIALAQIKQAMQAVNEGYESGDIFHAYYRYANDLLFDSSEFKIGSNWVVCDRCPTMTGDSSGSYLGRRCADVRVPCQGDGEGSFRKLEWSDLNPND